MILWLWKIFLKIKSTSTVKRNNRQEALKINNIHLEAQVEELYQMKKARVEGMDKKVIRSINHLNLICHSLLIMRISLENLKNMHRKILVAPETRRQIIVQFKVKMNSDCLQ
jgi:hypothetical protein